MNVDESLANINKLLAELEESTKTETYNSNDSLREDINDLVEWGLRLGNNSSPSEIISYIDKCIKLKCKLIKII